MCFPKKFATNDEARTEKVILYLSVDFSRIFRFVSIRTLRLFVFVLVAKIPVSIFEFLFLCAAHYKVALIFDRIKQSAVVITMKLVVLLLIALSITTIVESKVYLSCELAKEFSRNEMERHLIPHWICLVQAESQGNTSKIVDQPNLTTNYGIFQVKELHKCFIYGFTDLLFLLLLNCLM